MKVVNRSDLTQRQHDIQICVLLFWLGPRGCLDGQLWRGFVAVTPVSSQVAVAGQTVDHLNAASLGVAGESVSALVQGLHT